MNKKVSIFAYFFENKRQNKKDAPKWRILNDSSACIHAYTKWYFSI